MSYGMYYAKSPCRNAKAEEEVRKREGARGAREVREGKGRREGMEDTRTRVRRVPRRARAGARTAGRDGVTGGRAGEGPRRGRGELGSGEAGSVEERSRRDGCGRRARLWRARARWPQYGSHASYRCRDFCGGVL